MSVYTVMQFQVAVLLWFLFFFKRTVIEKCFDVDGEAIEKIFFSMEQKEWTKGSFCKSREMVFTVRLAMGRRNCG